MTEDHQSETPIVIPPAKSARAQLLEKYQRRFEPGQSGNPGGRPKSNRVNKALLVELDEVDEKTGKTGAELIAQAWVKQAKRGNMWAIREILDRTEGKIPTVFIGDVSHNVSDIKAKLLQKLSQPKELPELTEGEQV